MSFLNYSLFKDFLLTIFGSKNEARRAENVSMVLRNHDEFFIPTSRLKTFESFPLYLFPKLWVNFPTENIKFICNVHEFNLSLKEHFIDNPSLNVVCEKAFVHLVIHVYKFGSDILFQLIKIQPFSRQ
jgi:hypothetical protein